MQTPAPEERCQNHRKASIGKSRVGKAVAAWYQDSGGRDRIPGADPLAKPARIGELQVQ